ncbi:hypothetical protein GE21DRAFT_2370 [Neurospora crassa]|uniref:Uncharacterized protein n=1 Tax=Neurospora crassa (strain ATCC 24698 / 74-OR23-1A / CBS 708.71 / DSM 1257 / FGSC 987) TaxID=367110 RepID=V5IRH0_NEUCR|nr:hypothetical protein NCU16468 [Neurospora crassa OR74A]ESA44364.1 hypothetical protein NCU16468 [Neurospora crassa OR74A]KHE89299.1 hypothetical protein GE21DRAFT_2370 [Neurospora crassa]|eukprot:XP_011393431.1 hypothetical protein NCU16468 [Neurospora crassa OR74A]
MSSPSTLMLLQLSTHWPSGTPDDTHVRHDSPSAHKQFTQKYGRGFEAERTFVYFQPDWEKEVSWMLSHSDYLLTHDMCATKKANAPQSILTGDCVHVVGSASNLFLH